MVLTHPPPRARHAARSAFGDATVRRLPPGRRHGTTGQHAWLDATFVKVRQDGRVVSRAVVIAIGVRMSGEREVLGVDGGRARMAPSGSLSSPHSWPAASAGCSL